MISPLAARSLARLTSSVCASSTSRSRTGPIACMSSTSILAARVDMFLRKNSRTASVAPLSAMPSLSLSTWRIRVCAEPASRRTRSSKVNIRLLMRSADSRLASSSEVMKRVSLRRQILLQQALGGVVVAEQRAGGGQPADEFQQQLLDLLRIDGAEGRHHDRDLAEVVVVEQDPDFGPMRLAQREHQDGGALRTG